MANRSVKRQSNRLLKQVFAFALLSSWALVGSACATVQSVTKSESKQTRGFLTTFDQSSGLATLIERAVGPENLGNINWFITQEHFPLKGTGVRKVFLRVEPSLFGETLRQAAARLVKEGYVLAGTGELAGFLYDHPAEVDKQILVFAISKNARWMLPDGCVYVPGAGVNGASRAFILGNFEMQRHSNFGILVYDKNK